MQIVIGAVIVLAGFAGAAHTYVNRKNVLHAILLAVIAFGGIILGITFPL